MAFEVIMGSLGLRETCQDEFPPTTICKDCGGQARHAFTVIEKFNHLKSGHVCDLYENEPEAMWLHDLCAVSIYFCKECLEAVALYNQS